MTDRYSIYAKLMDKNRLVELKQLGLSQSERARILGVNARTLVKWEKLHGIHTTKPYCIVKNQTLNEKLSRIDKTE